MARRGENIYKRKDGRWEGRYIKSRHPDKRIHYGYVYAYSFQEIKKKLLEMKYIYKNTKNKTIIVPCTVKDWIFDWLDKEIIFKVKPSTYSSYQYKLKKYVLPCLGELSVDKIRKYDIQKLVNKLSNDGLSVTTIRTVIQIFKLSLKKLFVSTDIQPNFFEEINYPFFFKKKIRSLSEVEQKKIEKKADTSETGLSVLLALHTGLRIGEISALKWEDINFDKKEITVKRTMQRIFSRSSMTKTEIYEGFAKSPAAHRTIPLNKRILTALNKKRIHNTSEYVVGKNDHYFEPRAITYQFKKIINFLNLPDIHFHQLRHTFATRLLEKGADIASVSALLGHNSVKMTLDVYTDSLMSQRKKWINRIG